MSSIEYISFYCNSFMWLPRLYANNFYWNFSACIRKIILLAKMAQDRRLSSLTRREAIAQVGQRRLYNKTVSETSVVKRILSKTYLYQLWGKHFWKYVQELAQDSKIGGLRLRFSDWKFNAPRSWQRNIYLS